MASFTTNAVPAASTVQYEDEFEKADAALQVTFSTLMDQSGYYKTSSFYKSVKCLLVSWVEGSDDLHTDKEVRDLAGLLEEKFHYKVFRVYLDSSAPQLPQIQLMKYTADFVYNEDGYQTLLLVYYAGHGSSGNGARGLTLHGKRKLSESPDELNGIVWNHIEDNLRSTKADVLEIFDCCYAGDLGRTRQSWSYRSFEFLGACSSGTTRSPGDESFTRALIWALQALVEEQSRFLVSELSCKIREAPNFPKEQMPVQLDRGSHSLQRIMLAPLPESSHPGDSTVQDSNVAGPQGLLNLNFIFDKPPTKELITKFAETLNRFMWQDKMPVNRVVWGGLTSWEGVQPSFRANVQKMHAVKAFKEAGRRLKMRHKSGEARVPGVPTSTQSSGAQFLSPSPTPSGTS